MRARTSCVQQAARACAAIDSILNAAYVPLGGLCRGLVCLILLCKLLVVAVKIVEMLPRPRGNVGATKRFYINLCVFPARGVCRNGYLLLCVRKVNMIQPLLI